MKIYIITITTSTDNVVDFETFEDRKTAKTTFRHYFTDCIKGSDVKSANYTDDNYKVVYSNGNWINMHLFEEEMD